MSGLVSVIMPNYNGEKFIKETIMSVINQTYTNWELLIVDDCSIDNSAEIIKDFCRQDGRIKLFINEKNSGAAASRNLALREASGKWIAFLDSDDLWLPEKLEKQISFMVNNGYRFSYSYYEQIDENSRPMNKLITGPKKISLHRMFCYNYIGCLTAMYDAEYVGLMQIDDKIGNGRNDYALWLKLSQKCNCYLLKENLGQYRIRNNSLSHRGGVSKLIKTHYELFKISENKNAFIAFLCTLRNLFYGFWKKVIYVKKLQQV